MKTYRLMGSMALFVVAPLLFHGCVAEDPVPDPAAAVDDLYYPKPWPTPSDVQWLPAGEGTDKSLLTTLVYYRFIARFEGSSTIKKPVYTWRVTPNAILTKHSSWSKSATARCESAF